jgi:acyl-CoA thioesterase II
MNAALTVDRLAEYNFRGTPTKAVPTRIFGGQLVAQALMAASLTVEDERPLHSLHSYFLRPGLPELGLQYRVEALRDGRALSTRQVVASQEGRDIYQLSASFHEREEGVSHQLPSIDGLDVDRVEDFEDLFAEADKRWIANIRKAFPFEVRFAEAPPRAAVRRNEPVAPRQRIFIRWPASPGATQSAHNAALAFMSDAFLLSTSTFPHGRLFGEPGVQGSSLDHAIWFHREFRADDWLLYEMESTWAGGARALCKGHVFERGGTLVATVMQEGLIRFDPS